jgi:hypothetical protein
MEDTGRRIENWKQKREGVIGEAERQNPSYWAAQSHKSPETPLSTKRSGYPKPSITRQDLTLLFNKMFGIFVMSKRFIMVNPSITNDNNFFFNPAPAGRL